MILAQRVREFSVITDSLTYGTEISERPSNCAESVVSDDNLQ